MLVVIQAQSGDIVFNPKNIYRRIDMIRDPRYSVLDKSTPSGVICCDDGIPLCEYKKAERAKEVLTNIIDAFQYAEKHSLNIVTIRMPKE